MAHTTSIRPGQRWRSNDGDPDIQIAGRAVNRDDGWAITSPGAQLRLVSSSEILAGYRLVEEYRRPGTG